MDLSLGGTPGVGDFHSLAGIHAIWGSMNTTRLAEVCDVGVSYVTISMAPNHGSYEYDGYRNFALLCYATALENDDEAVSEEGNLQACDAMFKDIEYCHGQNVKVLLGIGKEFGQIAYKLLGKDNFYYGLHMFMDEDISDSVHAYEHWALTIRDFRNLRSNLFIAATPSCTIGNQNDVLRDYQIDSLFVPFKYASCDSWNDQHVQNRLTVDNVLSNWGQRIVDGESKQAMLFITLNPPELKTATTQPERPAEWLCKYQDKNDNLLGFFLEDSPVNLRLIHRYKSELSSVARFLAEPCPKHLSAPPYSLMPAEIEPTSTVSSAPSSALPLPPLPPLPPLSTDEPPASSALPLSTDEPPATSSGMRPDIESKSKSSMSMPTSNTKCRKK